jgi:hypothetical protein
MPRVFNPKPSNPTLHDLGYFDLAQKTLQPLDNPFGPRLSPMSPVRSVTHLSGLDTGRTIENWCRVRDLNPRPTVYKTAALPLS